MIFSKDVLFIHVPKTGGTSTTFYLLGVLPEPIYYSHPFRDEVLPNRAIVEITGRRHESLAEARDVVADYGFDIHRFPLILAAIRNPYDLEVSRYAYLRAGLPWERGEDLELALASDFERFAVKSQHRGGHWWGSDPETHAALGFDRNDRNGHPYPDDLATFYTLDGEIPENLRVIRFEHLAGDLIDALRTIGIDGGGEVPWFNRSPHDDYRSYYTRRAEEAVYDRYRWAFDRGFYPRLDPASLPDSVSG